MQTKSNDEEVQARHEQEVQLLTNHNKVKKESQDKVNADLKKIADDFSKYKAYVDQIEETEKLVKQIEESKVQCQFLKIQVECLEGTVEHLNESKENLVEQKKQADAKNEQLRIQLKSTEEVSKKRIATKLNRDKGQKLKDLIVELDNITDSNKEYSGKLVAKVQEYDKTLADKIAAEEALRYKQKELEDDDKTVTAQEATSHKLKTEIDGE